MAMPFRRSYEYEILDAEEVLREIDAKLNPPPPSPSEQAEEAPPPAQPLGQGSINIIPSRGKLAPNVFNADRLHTPRVLIDYSLMTARTLLTLENVRFGKIPRRNATEVFFRLHIQSGIDLLISKISIAYFCQSVALQGAGRSDDNGRCKISETVPRPPSDDQTAEDEPHKYQIRTQTNENGGIFEVGVNGDGEDIPTSLPIAVKLSHSGDLAFHFHLTMTYTSAISPSQERVVKHTTSTAIQMTRAELESFKNSKLMDASWVEMMREISNECKDVGMKLVLGPDLEPPVLGSDSMDPQAQWGTGAGGSGQASGSGSG